MDTRSGHDLVPQQSIDISSIPLFPVDTAVALSTANGIAAAAFMAHIHVSALSQVSKALVLPSTPLVLIVGRRCMEEGYSFIWEANSEPYMKGPDGRVVALKVRGYVPYLVDMGPMPARASHEPTIPSAPQLLRMPVTLINDEFEGGVPSLR